MIELPRVAWPFQPGCVYLGEVSRIVMAPLPALSPDGLSCVAKIAVRGKLSADRRRLGAPEGPELKEFLHFDGGLRPLNDLARQMVAALPAPVERREELASLEGRMGRFRLGEPDRHTAYNPVTDWRPVSRPPAACSGQPTRRRYVFRHVGRQFFSVRFDDGHGIDRGSVAVRGATEKLHAILRAAPGPVGYAELDGTARPGTPAPRCARRPRDESGLTPSGGPADRVLDTVAVAGCLREIRSLGDEIEKAHAGGAAFQEAEARTRRAEVLRFLATNIDKGFWGVVKRLEEACQADDRAREKDAIERLVRRAAKGRAGQSDADALRDRVRNGVAYGIEMLREAGLGRLAAHLETHLQSENGAYRYTATSLIGAWRL